MKVIRARNHSDCSIKCNGSGFAIYKLKFGPCMTSCDEAQAPAVFNRLADLEADGNGFSGSMSLIRRKIILQTMIISQLAYDSDGLRARLADLASINQSSWDERLSVAWDELDFEAYAQVSFNLIISGRGEA